MWQRILTCAAGPGPRANPLRPTEWFGDVVPRRILNAYPCHLSPPVVLPFFIHTWQPPILLHTFAICCPVPLFPAFPSRACPEPPGAPPPPSPTAPSGPLLEADLTDEDSDPRGDAPPAASATPSDPTPGAEQHSESRHAPDSYLRVSALTHTHCPGVTGLAASPRLGRGEGGSRLIL